MSSRLSRFRPWLFPIVVIVLISALLYAFATNRDQNPVWLSYLEIGTSIVLSTALVVLYFFQYRILDEQTNILRGRHTPYIDLENIEIQSISVEDSLLSGEIPQEMPCVQFDAINNGNDIAKNVQLKCVTSSERFNSNLAARVSLFLSNRFLLRSVVDTPHFLPRAVTLDSDDLPTDQIHTDGLVLRPDMDEPVSIHGAIMFDYPNRGQPSTLLDTVDIYADHGISSIHLGLVLTYENAFGSEYERILKSLKISPLESGMTLQNLLENSEDYPINSINYPYELSSV